MFKKFIILLITVCYFLSVTGTTIDKFYCCGKLKKTSIFFRLEHKTSCSKKMSMKKGCCLYDQSFYKVKDTHQSEVSTTTPDPLIVESVRFYTDCIPTKNLTTKVALLQYSNGPPLSYFEPPLFLLNSNFRI